MVAPAALSSQGNVDTFTIQEAQFRDKTLTTRAGHVTSTPELFTAPARTRRQINIPKAKTLPWLLKAGLGGRVCAGTYCMDNVGGSQTHSGRWGQIGTLGGHSGWRSHARHSTGPAVPHKHCREKECWNDHWGF